MDVPGVSIKEVVDVVESRLWGGRFLVRLVLYLGIATMVVATVLFIYHKAVIPLARVADSLVSGASFNLRVTFGDVIVWLTVLAGGWIIVYFTNKLFTRNLEHTERLMATVEELTKRVQVFQLFIDRLTNIVEDLGRRVDTLEKNQQTN